MQIQESGEEKGGGNIPVIVVANVMRNPRIEFQTDGSERQEDEHSIQ